MLLSDLSIFSIGSFGNVDVETKVALTLNVRLNVGHLEVVIDPVDNEVWEPRIFSTNLEQFVEELQAFLSKVVTKNLETHESLILRKCLSE